MIVYSSLKCLECGEILQSKHRHDFQTCSCPNTAMIDGGGDYIRYGAVDRSKIELKTLTDEASIEEIREKMVWGRNYDKDKNLLPATEWIKVKDITEDHLNALIEYTVGKEVNKIFRREKEYRKLSLSL